MKNKIIIAVISCMLIGIIAIFMWPSNEKSVEPEIKDNVKINAPIEIPSELTVKSKNNSTTYVIDPFEEEMIREENLVNFNYLSDVYRFVFSYEEDSNQMILVYEDQTLRFDFNENTMSINNSTVVENDMVVIKAGVRYLNTEAFKLLFNLESLIIEEPFLSIQLDFNSNDTTYKVKSIMDEKLNALPEKINMTWEAVYSRETDVSSLYEMPGLDVISPVWYDLEDGTGSLKSKKQDDYIVWAGMNQLQLWPAVTNGFDTEMTHELITSIENRTQFIDKLVNIYKGNEFPGINIDFENIYKEDQAALSQFIAELTAAFHREGIIVSMDVTFAGGSDTWSKCYDRKVLGEWVDFIVVMSYDQHWGSSPISGTVAGIDWVDDNLQKLTQEVDAKKIIMGIPFYMRVWFERPSSEKVNSMRVTSDAITMHKMEEILNTGEHTVLWDESTGQNYISFIDPEANALKKIWIEDETSLAIKVDLVHKYNLKGIASWRRGYELRSIWDVLDEALRN